MIDDKAIPHWVPSSMRASLDFGELAEQTPNVAHQQRQLERELDAHIAAYRSGSVGRPNGLCEIYQAARLSESEIARLKAVEASVPGVVFVAYQKPLSVRSSRRNDSG